MLTVEIDDDKIYTTADIATMIRISRHSVTKMCDSGILPSHKVPPLFKRRRVVGSDLREFFRKRMPTTDIVSITATRDRLIQSVRDFVAESDHREYDAEAVRKARDLIAEIDGVKS